MVRTQNPGHISLRVGFYYYLSISSLIAPHGAPVTMPE